MLILRDFLYLDKSKLHSFLSQIQGGMVSEVIETISQGGNLSGGVKVGITPIGGNLDASKNKGTERQQNILLTEPAYFEALYQSLNKTKSILDISDMSIEKILKLSKGQFVEFHGFATPPIVENWIDRLNTLFSFFERNYKVFTNFQGNRKAKSSPNFSAMELRQIKSIIDLLVDFMNLTRKDPGKQYIRISSRTQTFYVWCGLIPDFSLIPLKSALPADISLIGRIDHFLRERESEKIVDISVFSQFSKIEGFLEVLNSINILSNQMPISETDLEAIFPDFFVSPMAIFQ